MHDHPDTETSATNPLPKTAAGVFATDDRLVAWVKAHPEAAAESIRSLRAIVRRLEQQTLEDSWRLNPDRMGA